MQIPMWYELIAKIVAVKFDSNFKSIFGFKDITIMKSK